MTPHPDPRSDDRISLVFLDLLVQLLSRCGTNRFDCPTAGGVVSQREACEEESPLHFPGENAPMKIKQLCLRQSFLGAGQLHVGGLVLS